MPRFIVLLRGVNVGKGTAGHARAIRAAVQVEFNLDIPVIVLSAREFNDIVTQNPLALNAVDHSRHRVAFAQDSAVIQGLAGLNAMVNPPERLRIGRPTCWAPASPGTRATDAVLIATSPESLVSSALHQSCARSP